MTSEEGKKVENQNWYQDAGLGNWMVVRPFTKNSAIEGG